MRKDKTLDEALDEMEKWGDKVSDTVARLTPKQVIEYYRRAQADLEMQTGQRLNLRIRPAPKRRKKKAVKSLR